MAADDQQEIEQWVAKVIGFSSQYDSIRWAAKNLCGEPRVFNLENNYGDIRGSWTPPYRADDVEWIEWEVERCVRPSGVHFYETFNPGAVFLVQAWDYTNACWVSIYQGEPEAAPAEARIFSPPLDAPPFATNRFRFEMHCGRVAGYNEIDCVRVTGVAISEEAEAALRAEDVYRQRVAAFDAAVSTNDDETTSQNRKQLKFRGLALEVDVGAANRDFGAVTLVDPDADDGGAGIGAGVQGSLHPFAMQIRQGILTPKAVQAQSLKFGLEMEDPTAMLVRAVAGDSLAGVSELLAEYPDALSHRPSADAMDATEQWVARVLNFSSQYDTASWKATNLIGPPRVYPQYGDIAGAWTHPNGSTNTEWIEFEVENEVWVTQFDIYETYHPGALTHVQAYDPGLGEYRDLWVNNNPAPAGNESRIFTPPIVLPDFATNRFKLILEAGSVGGYNEYDCVKVYGGQVTGTARGDVTNLADPTHALRFDVWQRSPLMVACKNGNAEMAAYLMSQDCDPTRKSLFGHTPLSWAVQCASRAPTPLFSPTHPRYQYEDLVMILLSNPRVLMPFQGTHGEAYAADELGDTVFHKAVTHELSDLLGWLLLFDDRLNATQTNKAGQTPRMLASSPDVIRVFETHEARDGAARAAAPEHNVEVLSNAVAAQDPYTLRLLLRAWPGATTAVVDAASLRTALHAAADAGALPLVALLLSYGADPLTGDDTGNTALHLAAAAGHTNVVRMMMAQPGVPARLAALQSAEVALGDEEDGPRSVNANGDTILHAIARGGKVAMARFFLTFSAAAAMMTTNNNQGMLPAHLASTTELVDGFNAANVYMAKEHGLQTPRPFTPRGSRICAVCFMPPPAENEGMVYSCPCNAELCVECLSHTANAALHDGDFPTCPNMRCHRMIPMDVLREHLPVNQLLLIAALVVNEKVVVENIYKSNCSVCNRANDIRPVLEGDDVRFRCGHCGIFCCVVCSQIYPQLANPQTEEERQINQLDNAIHEGCKSKLVSLQAFNTLVENLHIQGMRRCPRPECQQLGVKDDACCHLHCGCGRDYCYVCARNPEHGLDGVSVGTHGTYDGPWPTDPTYCMMYMHHFARVDARIAALGCGQPDCRPSGNCPSDATCRVARDRAVGSLLASIRARCFLLDFMRRMGKQTFVNMITRFGYRPVINQNYFNGQFNFAGDEIPSWLDFEPEEMREFFSQRPHWFIFYTKLDEYNAVRDAYNEGGHAAVQAYLSGNATAGAGDATTGADAPGGTTAGGDAPGGGDADADAGADAAPPFVGGGPDNFIRGPDGEIHHIELEVADGERRRRPCIVM